MGELGYDQVEYWLLQSKRVPGWLTDAEARQLYFLAQGVSRKNNPVIVELGSWLGKSSVMIAGSLSLGSGGRLYCIDPFGVDENPEYQRLYYDPLLSDMQKTQEQTFRGHVEECGLSALVEPICGYSFEVVKTWAKPIDMLFIDANHEYESVARDFENWTPFVGPGGVVALHDVTPDWPGPTRVRDENFQSATFHSASQVDSLAWAIKSD